MTRAALTLLSAVLLTACGNLGRLSGPVTGSASPGHSIAEILERLPRPPSALDTLYATAEVSVTSPDESGRFSARIAYRKADSMLVRVRFPLGIEGARVLVTTDSVFVYDRIEKTLISGTPERMRAVLPVAVAGTDLVELATGFMVPDPDVNWTVRWDSLRYELRHPNGTERYLVDAEAWRIVHAEYKDPDGNITEQRWYLSFAELGGVMVPRRVSVSHPMDDVRLVMALRTLDTHPGPLSFDLDVRPDTRRHVLY